MELIKIGFMPFGVHVNVDDGIGRPFIDYDALASAKKALEDMGFAVKDCDVVSYRSQAKEALASFKAANVDVLVMYSTTWVWASELTWAAQEFNGPLLLWSSSASRGWPGVGALEVHGAFDEIGLRHKFIMGNADDERTLRKVRTFCLAGRAKQALNGMTFGLVGGRGMGQATGVADASQWMCQFGVEVEHMDQLVVAKRAESIAMADVEEAYKLIGAKFAFMPPLEGAMEKSVRLYVALKQLYVEKRFDFASVKCFPELGDTYATPCLAQSLLADEGFTSSCIGDMNTALTAQVLGYFTDSAVFSGDVQNVRYWENIVKVVCDGGCPPSLCASCVQCKVGQRGLPTEGEAGGMGISAVLRQGRCTLAHLARVKGKFVMHITPGEVVIPENLDEALRECGMPHWSHAFVKIDGDGEHYYLNQRSEFTCLAYGDLKEELVDFCALSDIESIIT